MNSLYEEVNVKIIEDNMPGKMRGSMTWKNVFRAFAPHTLAASNSLSSRPSKVVHKIKMLYGAQMAT